MAKWYIAEIIDKGTLPKLKRGKGLISDGIQPDVVAAECASALFEGLPMVRRIMLMFSQMDESDTWTINTSRGGTIKLEVTRAQARK